MTDLADSFTTLRQLVSYEYGFGYASPPSSSTTKGAIIDSCIRSGIRRAYWPGKVQLPNGAFIVPDWNFLKLEATLTTYQSYSTGTVSVENGSKDVTLDGGTFPTWITDDTYYITIDSTDYLIHTRTSGTVVELSEAWGGAGDSGVSYEVEYPTPYSLPSDFGSFIGRMTITSLTGAEPIEVIGENRLRDLEAGISTTGTPLYAALINQSHDGTANQAWKVDFWPAATSELTIGYQYRLNPNMLDTTALYAYGGPSHTEMILEACLSVAEERRTGGRGIHYANFIEQVATAVVVDGRRDPQFYGSLNRSRKPVERHSGDYLTTHSS